MANQNENIQFLIIEIKDKIGKPVSSRVVVATIESLGIRDIDTPIDFGMPSVFALAELVYEKLTNSSEYIGMKNKKEREAELKNPGIIPISDYLWVKTKIFAQYYPLGLFHLFPVILQILAIIFFGYSLWTFVGFNHVQSTAVVLGVIIGLVVTGGFVQVIGRQTSFYWNHEDYMMTKKIVNYLLKIGTSSIILFLGLLFIGNVFFYVYPYQVLCIIFIYAFLIGLLLLLLAPLHTIKQRWIITIAVFIGTAVAILLKTQTNISIYFTHWIGIGVAIIISRVFLTLFFRNLIRKKKAFSKGKVKPILLIYHNYKYFFYGLLIYIFIFIDRVLAWSSGINGSLPFVIYFEKNYELGMDLAILVFLLLAGVLEYGVASFSKFIDFGQKSTPYNTPKAFGRLLYKMYWQHVALLLGTSIALFILIYNLIHASWGYSGQFNESLDSVSVNVSIIGGLGYMFLAWGMLNTLYLFTLGQPDKPLKAIVLACTLNLLIGLFLSRFVAYEYSVFGMLFGSILFMGLTLRANIKFFKNLDYYYYAAY